MRKLSVTLCLSLFFCVLLTGCGAGYKKTGGWFWQGGFAGGFQETRLGENVWNVTAKGNAYTSATRIANIVMLRSADLALQNGFTHFAFASGSTSTKTGVNYQAPTAYTSGSITTYSKPGKENTVVMFNGKPDNVKGVVYDAAFVCRSVGQKLGAECGRIR